MYWVNNFLFGRIFTTVLWSYFHSTVEQSSETFPTLAFCFGFKQDVNDDDILNTRNIEKWDEGQSIQTMNSTFREITFDFYEIFSKRTTYSFGNETNQNQRIEIMEVYSELGRCYSYYSDEKIDASTSWRFRFNNTL